MDTRESTAVPGVHAGVVTNPDGSNIGSTIATGAATSAKQDALLIELQIFNGSYAQRVDDTGSGVTYHGWAVPGTATSAASWRIRRITDSGTPTDTVIDFADGNNNLDNIWDNRAALSYS